MSAGRRRGPAAVVVASPTSRRSVSRRERHPFFGRLVIAAFLALLFGAALLAALGDDGDGTANDRAALAAYGQAIEPLVEKAGEVVGLGLRAGVEDIHGSRYDDATLRNMTRAWRDDLRRVHARLDRLDPPGVVADAHALYLESFEGYVRVADTLAAAVEVHGDRRVELAERAAHLGERADAIYDRADRLVGDERRRLGLPVETPVIDHEGAPRA